MNTQSMTTTARHGARARGEGLQALAMRLLRTGDERAPLLARLTLGVVILPHGAQKLLGWFGGSGFTAELQFFTETMGFPAALGVLAIVAESFGALALLAGLLGRVAALGIAVVMAVAALTVHVQNGFFMNWFGNQAGEGFEYHLLALGLAAIVMLRGSGAFSMDRLLTEAP